MSSIKTDDFAKEVVKTLEEYSESTTEILYDEIRNAINAARNEARQRSPGRSSKVYAKGWRTRIDKESSTEASAVAFAGKLSPVTHLLEFGHATRNGGRTREFPHVAPAQETAEKYLDEALTRRLESD